MKFLFSFLLLVGMARPVIFGAYDINHVLGQMDNKIKTVQNIKFDFEQTVRFNAQANPTQVKGEAIFAPAGRMRIWKKSPEEQLTVSNGNKVWVYTPSYKQVWQGSARGWVGLSMLPKGVLPMNTLVSDLISNFNLKIVEENAKNESGVWIAAEPKENTMGYALKLLVSTNSWLPTQTVYQSDSAEIVTTMSSTQLNSNSSEKLFRFVPPKGTDIIPLN